MESFLEYLSQTYLEWISSFLFILAVWLTARKNIWCWPIGIVGTCIAVAVYTHAKFYSDAILYGIYIPLLIYGWMAWLWGGENRTALGVGRISRLWLGISVAIGTISTAGLGYYMATRTDAAVPYWDAGTTCFSLVTQVIQAHKLLECWFFWMAINTVAIGLYVHKGLYVYAALHLIYQGLALYGYVEWRRDLHNRVSA